MIVNFEQVLNTFIYLWKCLLEFSFTLNQWLTYEFQIGGQSYMLIEILFGSGIISVVGWVLVKFISGL